MWIESNLHRFFVKKIQGMQYAVQGKFDSNLNCLNKINLEFLNNMLSPAFFTKPILRPRITFSHGLRVTVMAAGLILAAPVVMDGSARAANSATVVITPTQTASDSLLSSIFSSTPAKTATADKVIDAFDGNDGRPALPRARPDYIATLGGIEVEIQTPSARPSMEDILPHATADIQQMVQREAGQSISKIFDLTLSSGETLAKLLKKADFTNQDIASVSDALTGKIDLRRLQIGTRFTAALDTAGQAVALQVHMPRNSQKTGAFKNVFLDHYVIRHDGITDPEIKGWQSIRAIRPIELRSVHAGNEISLSLYEAAKDVQIPMEVLDEFVRVMSFSVDFQREVQSGDQFELIYDSAIDKLTGERLSTDSLEYAGIVLSGKKMGFYRFVHPNGKEGWYDRNGESAVRTLMRTPVNGARLSSGFGMRRHPVTGYSAMHKGLDFAVPKGTPVLAAGTGHIEFAGWNGSYGKYIRIRHNSTYKTAYAHLSGLAAGIRNGYQVQQGEVIGYVGSTGRSTGPHLHYEILVNNRKLDPLTVKLPTGQGVPADLMASFNAQVKSVESKMRDSITPRYAGVSLQQASLSR